MLDLQRLAGNRAVQRLVAGGMLRAGSRGPQVRELQSALNSAGASLTVDGAFGPATVKAVVAFQRAAGLGADGVVGSKTQAALAAGGVRMAIGGPTGPDPRWATVRSLVAAVSRHLGGSPTGRAAPPVALPLEEPGLRQGWFDDAVDWVEETGGEVADAVGDAVGGAVDAVGEAAGGASDWVKVALDDTAGAIGDAVGGATSWVEETAGDVADTVSATAAEAVADAAELGSQLKTLAESVADGAGPQLDRLVRLLQASAGQGIGLRGDSLDGLVSQAAAALAEVTGADPLAAGKGRGTLTLTPSRGTSPGFTFTDETFGGLRATLTARTTEIGSAKPSTPVITVDGANASTLPGDQKITNANVSITETIILPTWTRENGPQVQDVQRAEWTRYAAAVSAHEDLHVADDRRIYGEAAAALPGKTVTEAFALVNAATTAADAEGPVRDVASPAPTLQPAGVERV